LDIGTQEPTRYEVVMVHEGKETHLGFTARTGRSPLLDMAQANSEALLAIIPEDDDSATLKGGKTKAVLTFGPVIIRYSGRTERDVATLKGAA